MSRKSTQNFQSIPFHKFLEKVLYKAEFAGIRVVFTEEAYTSKASFKDRDLIPAFEKGVEPLKFSGKRVRGLFKLSDGSSINADVNGSANIGRKVINDVDFLNRVDRSLAARPVRVNPLKSFNRSNSEHLGPVDSANSKS
jgi:transposase